jgi:hypothetical protein
MEIKCMFADKCPFYQKKNPIHEAMYKTNISRFCDNNFTACALYQIIKDKDVSIIPKDLYPNQVWRIKKVLAL